MRKIFVFLVLVTALFGLRTSFLMPDEAFIPKASLQNNSVIALDIELGKDIYLYADGVEITDTDTGDVLVFESVSKPQAVEHHGETVYLEPPHIEVSLAKTSHFEGSREVGLKVVFQGCSEQGLCYEPIEKTFTFTVNGNDIPLTSSASDNVEASDGSDTIVSETSAISQIIQEGSFGVIILTFFGFGLLLALTPCMFPMVPILSSVIVAQGEGLTAKRAFFLSLVYVLAMAVAYTIAGVLAGLFGANLQAALQAPWMISLFAALFVVLALSMFDLFEFQMPNFIQSRLSEVGSHQKGVIGVATMGFLSALIVGPCVAAPLAGALIYIGQSGDAILGGMALFALSMGMGMPLLLVGTAAGKYMPKPGGWMDAIKQVFGFLMLGVAVWMVSRIIPGNITLLLWSVLLVFAAVGMGALEPIRGRCIRCWRAAKKSTGIILFMYAIALFVGGLTGATNVMDPLEELKAGKAASYGATTVPDKLVYTKVTSLSELDALLAKEQGKKIMIDFYADWCTSCRELEQTTFKDRAVLSKLAGFTVIKADLTANDEDAKALSKRYGVFGPPTMIFINEDGKVIKGAEIVGYKAPDEFLKLLNRL